MAQKAGLSEVVSAGGNLRISSAELADSVQVRLQRMYPGARYFAQTKAVAVPMKKELADAELIEWVSGLLVAIFGAEVAQAEAEAEKTA